MIFVTADRSRTRLEALTKILVSAFPGSTIYQHTDLLRASNDVLQNKVEAVFLEADPEKGLDLMQLLHRQKPDLPVFLISETEALREKAAEAGANGYFVLPQNQQQLLEAVTLVKTRRMYHDN